MSIVTKYERRVSEANSLLCVGLDSDISRLPERFVGSKNPQYEFNQWIVEETAEFASAFKLNLAFYEARGAEGIRELTLTLEYLRSIEPTIMTIADAKRGDIGSTNVGLVKAIFSELGFDAVTLNPYLGREALLPFLERKDKACIIVCRTSNPGAGEFQDLRVKGKRLWQIVAEKVVNEWNANNNCMLVVGATYPMELSEVRKIVGDMTLLVPGVGAQGGDIEKTVKAGLNSKGAGMIINSSRGIIFAADPREEAKKLRDEINKYRGL